MRFLSGVAAVAALSFVPALAHSCHDKKSCDYCDTNGFELLRDIAAEFPKVSSFCQHYTTKVNHDVHAIPTYLSRCRGHKEPEIISRACTCLYGASSTHHTTTATSTSSTTHPTITTTKLPTKPHCKENSCGKDLKHWGGKEFCKTFTKREHRHPWEVPQALKHCNHNPHAVSSACSCLYPHKSVHTITTTVATITTCPSPTTTPTCDSTPVNPQSGSGSSSGAGSTGASGTGAPASGSASAP
ncbi:MAG: hypothetical protein M4579_006947, partial [Chaenotheca gracillima]